MISKRQIHIAFDPENNCVGYMGLVDKGCFNKFTYLATLAVKKEYRSRGIGEALVRRFEEIGFNKEDRVFLLVSDFNKRAQSFYRKLGYKKVGSIPDLFRPGISENLLIKYKKSR
jgi:ribosomal protein S18 acetylase RimI-like enzyme